MKPIISRYFPFLFGFLLLNLSLSAEVRLPKILGSHMVLQRNQEIKIWGWADKGEKIVVEFNNIEKETRADSQGDWILTFPAMKAGGPHDMYIQGKNLIEVENILIGDVWVCSGQSNMRWSIEELPTVESDTAEARYSGIRLFRVPQVASKQPEHDIPSGEWQECTPENILPFSAVGYFFGREIHSQLRVPIGLLSSNRGGTNVETWTSAEAIARVEGFSEWVDNIASLDTTSEELKPNSAPALLFNGMIHPILNFNVNGVIWYQGERNANAGRSYQYRELFPLMINDWRKRWEQPDLPFLFVQLANFREPPEYPEESSWAELREAQLMALKLPQTGMAVTIDIGEEGTIHPKNKLDVGKRLALAALKIAYDKDIVYSGPIYKEMQIEGRDAILSFDHIGSGLMVRDKYGYVKGMAIAGPDKVFHWAKASVNDNKVIVHNDKVDKPIAVRYGWAQNPDDVNLYNQEGLPASPFRTDDWPGITIGEVYK
jgi:sialate O-acetylesterase